jgi:adenosylcobinamide-phosphate synthase
MLKPLNPLILMVAALLDIVLGDPHYPFHPVKLMGKATALGERMCRSLPLSPRLQGLILVLGVQALVFGATFMLLNLASRIHPWVRYILETYLAYSALAGGALWREVEGVLCLVKEGNLEGAKKRLSLLVSRDTEPMEEKDILIAATETLAENTSDGIIGPLLFLAVGGVPLAMIYKAADTMDSMVGYRTPRYLQFGWAAARLDDFLNFIPARLTVLYMALASGFLGLSGMSRVIRAAYKWGPLHPSPNSGYPEGAMAGALGIRLGGPCHYFGKPLERPWMGEGDPPDTFALEKGLILSKATFLTALLVAFIFHIL